MWISQDHARTASTLLLQQPQHAHHARCIPVLQTQPCTRTPVLVWGWVSRLAATVAAALAAFEADDGVDTRGKREEVSHVQPRKKRCWRDCGLEYDEAERLAREGLRRRRRRSHSPVTNDTTAAHRDLRLSLHAHLAGALKTRGQQHIKRYQWSIF